MTILGSQYNSAGDRVVWWDTDDRLRHDITSGTDVTTPFTEGENATADGLAAAQEELDSGKRLRDQLAAGLAAITAARDAAQGDIATRQAAATAAVTLKGQADAFVAKGAFTAADIGTLGSAVSQIAAALASIDGWAAAVDQNAVITDDALLWLGALVSENL